MTRYPHLSHEERFYIHQAVREGKRDVEIARALGRHASESGADLAGTILMPTSLPQGMLDTRSDPDICSFEDAQDKIRAHICPLNPLYTQQLISCKIRCVSHYIVQILSNKLYGYSRQPS